MSQACSYSCINITYSCTPVAVHAHGYKPLAFLLEVGLSNTMSFKLINACMFLQVIYLCNSLTSIIKIPPQSFPEVGTKQEDVLHRDNCVSSNVPIVTLLDHLPYHSHSSEHSRVSLLVRHSLPVCT
jgi:hypothetical protein